MGTTPPITTNNPHNTRSTKPDHANEVSLAEFVGLCSAACNRAVEAALAIPGVIRLSGSMGELKDLEDILRVAKNAGAKRILLPFSAIYDMPKIPMELAGSRRRLL